MRAWAFSEGEAARLSGQSRLKQCRRKTRIQHAPDLRNRVADRRPVSYFLGKVIFGTETDWPNGLETQKCSTAAPKRPQNAGSWRGLRNISAELE